ncbi:MAG: YdcF family protein [Erysipelotrichaceae bacterium]|nr:YdcF family protein [Erysipelotrichaceae bacterium]
MRLFDTLDKKPKVWNIAVLTLITIPVLVFLLVKRQDLYLASYVFCAYLLAVIVLLVRAFIRQLRYNPYSYNSIYYIAFALFVLSVLIFQIMITVDLHSPDHGNEVVLRNYLSNSLGSAKNYMLFSFPFIFIYSVALCISNISLIRHEGKSVYNLLGIILSILLVGGEVFLYVSDYAVSGSLREVMIHDILTNLFAAVYLYFECMLIGSIIVNIITVKHEPAKDKDFIIILGCGIRKDGTPMPLLAGRIERAYAFYRKQLEETGKAATFICSGGQGPDEVVSEAQSMAAYLLDKGVDPAHILKEDRSTDTYENMLYSKEIIDSIKKDAKVIFSTSSYHVFRAGIMARRVKMRATGIGAATRWYFWPNASVREFIGILSKHRLKQALILVSMVVFYTIFTYYFYKYLA